MDENENAQIPPAAAPTPTPVIDPAGADAGAPGSPTPDAPLVIDGVEIPKDLESVLDIDERERYEALLAKNAEAQGEQQTPPAVQPPAPTTPPTAEPQAPKPAAQPEPKRETVTVPKARLDEALAQRDRAAQQAAYWQGRAEGTTPAKADAPPPAPPVDPLAENEAARIALAEKFDHGEMTMTEFRKQDLVLERQAQEIRQEQVLQKVPKVQPTSSGDDILIQERASKLEAEHPYAKLIFPGAPTNDPVMRSRQQALHVEAAALVEKANPGLKQGAYADMLFQAELAKLSDRYGPLWFPDFKPATPAPAPAPGPAAPKPPSQAAKDRLAKMQTEVRQPPMPAAATPDTTGLTEARIEAMSDDELADMPAAWKEKFR